MLKWLKLQFESWLIRKQEREAYLRLQNESKIEYERAQSELNIKCESCEILKLELARIHELNKTLLNEITYKPTPEPDRPQSPISMPKYVPHSVKRHMMEREDRNLAKKLREEKERELVEELEKEVLGQVNG